jgi:hypothetical protein
VQVCSLLSGCYEVSSFLCHDLSQLMSKAMDPDNLEVKPSAKINLSSENKLFLSGICHDNEKLANALLLHSL